MTAIDRTAEQCIYMAEAYPTLNGDDTCYGFHDHSESVFGLAYELALRFQGTLWPSKAQTAWFLNDAQAIIDTHPEPDGYWHVSRTTLPVPRGCDAGILVNGVEYLIPASEWDPSPPEPRSTWLADRDLTEEEIDDDLQGR